MNKDNVLHLAKLARIDVSSEEAENLSREFEAILGYVSEVKKISASNDEEKKTLALKNVMRDDAEPHESGLYTEAILAEAPNREENYVKVKKIL